MTLSLTGADVSVGLKPWDDGREGERDGASVMATGVGHPMTGGRVAQSEASLPVSPANSLRAVTPSFGYAL